MGFLQPGEPTKMGPYGFASRALNWAFAWARSFWIFSCMARSLSITKISFSTRAGHLSLRDGVWTGVRPGSGFPAGVAWGPAGTEYCAALAWSFFNLGCLTLFR